MAAWRFPFRLFSTTLTVDMYLIAIFPFANVATSGTDAAAVCEDIIYHHRASIRHGNVVEQVGDKPSQEEYGILVDGMFTQSGLDAP